MNRFLVNIVSFFLLPCFSISGYAQAQAKIYGVVIDEFKQPIAQANIQCITCDSFTTSNNKGAFFLDISSKDSIKLVFFRVSYKRQYLTIMAKDFNKKVVMPLQKNATLLDEVVITSESSLLLEHQKKTLPLTSVKTETLANTSLNMDEVLNSISGIKIFRGGGEGSNSTYMVNGLSGKAVRIFYDNVPYEYTGYGKMPAAVPLRFFESIDIYRGVAPIELGADILGGAINIRSKKENSFAEASYGIGSFGTHKGDVSISSAIADKSSLKLQSFYTSSQNNFEVGGVNNSAIFITDDLGNKKFVRVQNFNNAFNSFFVRPMLTFETLKSKMSFWSSFTSLKKEIQHNRFDPTIVVGQAYWQNKQYAIGGHAHYDFSTNSEKNVRVNYSYTYENLHLNDISKNRYNWQGDIIAVNNVGGEILNYVARPFDIFYRTNKFFLRLHTSFKLTKNHALHGNITTTYDSRKTEDKLRDLNPMSPSTYFKSILSGAIKSRFFHERIHNTFTLKCFYYQTDIAEFDGITLEPLAHEMTKGSYIGISDAVRMQLSKKTVIKASYEYAIRLPDTDEFFGNGFFSFPTSSLKPEVSHNVNLGYAHAIRRLNIETNLFYRNTKDQILLLGTDFRNPKYENKTNFVTNGIELSFDFNPYPFLQFQMNGTWQDLRYRPNRKDRDYYFYNDRLPNTPYLFGNFKGDFKVANILQNNDFLLFGYTLHYTHQYFRLWESQGVEKSKGVIPEQILHGVSLQYAFKNLTFSAEVRNLTNAYAYDRFLTQLPGRSFYLKTIFQIHNN